MAGKKRVRDVPLYVWVRPDELEAIRGRMEEAGIRNMSAYIRKMALNGYILHVDLSPVQELVSLQRRCANNLNQVATHANSYGVYQEEIKSLQKDYPRLLLDGYGIHAGEYFRALFPDGWHDITLEVGWNETGPACWYISTPGFSDVCPVGLFVEV